MARSYSNNKCLNDARQPYRKMVALFKFKNGAFVFKTDPRVSHIGKWPPHSNNKPPYIASNLKLAL
jgi:hypothetical protein